MGSGDPLIGHLTDPHLGATWGIGDPDARLEAAIAAFADLPARPDAVVVTGDLTDNGTADEYGRAAAALDSLSPRVLVAAGNHDDRAAMRAAFGVPGEGDEPIRYVADLGSSAVVVLDTSIPAEDPGHLGDDDLAWLDATLADAIGTPVLLAMHHPPLLTGAPVEDTYALSDAGREGLGTVVRRHPHVAGILAGHLHRTIVTLFAGVPLVVLASTYVQARFRPGGTGIRFVDRPPSAALHALRDGALVAHVEPL